MAMNHKGEIFVVWQQYSEPGNDFLARIYFTSFDGENWSTPVPITDTLGMDWTPNIAVDTLGFPHVVWGSYATGEIYHQGFNGLSWSSPRNISQNAGESFFPQIAIDHKNTIHFVWHDNTTGSLVGYYRCFDGVSWSPTVIFSDSLNEVRNPRIAIDPQNNLHVSFHCYTGPPSSNWDVFYRKCQDGLWSNLTRLTTDTLKSSDSDIAITSDGRPVVVWDQAGHLPPIGPSTRYIYTTTLGDSAWTIPQCVANTSYSTGASVAIDREDCSHVVWELLDRTAYLSRIVYSDLRYGAWSTPTDLSGANPFAFDAHIRVDGMGICHVIWLGMNNCIYYTHQTGVATVDEAPPHTAMHLEQNYPNPFNSFTTVTYSISQASEVVLKIFDPLGRVVKTLRNSHQPPGRHSFVFDGSELSSGVYFCQLQINTQVRVRTMLLLR
jgi:hypothetical protein